VEEALTGVVEEEGPTLLVILDLIITMAKEWAEGHLEALALVVVECLFIKTDSLHLEIFVEAVEGLKEVVEGFKLAAGEGGVSMAINLKS